MREHIATTTPAVQANGTKLPKGDSNPGSRRARQIRAAEFEALKTENADLRAQLQAIRDAETDVDPQGGAMNAARMRKVMGQRVEADRGPTEKVLREWLVKNLKDFIGAMEEKERAERGDADLKAENEKLKARLAQLEGSTPGPDMGTAKAREVIDRLLAEFESEARA